jgi:hypothetical protein
MGLSNRAVAYLAGGMLALMGFSAPASAQVNDTNKWQYEFTPYLFLTGLNGDVGVRRLVADVDLSSSDVLDMLKFGVMGSVLARKSRWVIGFDGIYASLGDGKAIAILGDTGSLDFSVKETILQPVTGYTIGDSTWSVDFLGGVRYWNLSPKLDVDRTRRPSNERSGTKQWVDATGGVRFGWVPYQKVHFVAAADGGAGGAHSTWQVYSTLGYDVWRKWSISAGYRVLAVDYNKDDFVFDTRMKGALIAFTYKTM